MYRAKRISTDFENELKEIRAKYRTAQFPPRFVESVIREFKVREQTKNVNEEVDYIIPPWLFEIPKRFILLELPFCIENEKTAKRFLSKFNTFTKDTFSIAIKWVTKKIKHLFPLKDRNPHQACKVYEGTCSCGETYVGECIRNVEVRWNEHENPEHKSEPARHIRNNISHSFTWKVLMHAPRKDKIRKFLEAFFIALKKPSLNMQVESSELTLFRNGVT